VSYRGIYLEVILRLKIILQVGFRFKEDQNDFKPRSLCIYM
jgi:hypothetical protein